MSIRNFLNTPRTTRSTRSSQLSQVTLAGPSTLPSTPTPKLSRRRLEKSRSELSEDAEPTSEEALFEAETYVSAPRVSRARRAALAADRATKEYPAANNQGICFPINWGAVYHGVLRLEPERLGYRVRSVGQTGGGRKTSKIYNYGADLLYTDLLKRKQKIWLCKICHLDGVRDSAFYVNGNSHIVGHLHKTHRIVVETGELIPEGQARAESPWEVAARAGNNKGAAHTPWEESQLVGALIDWVIVSDQSFRDAASDNLRGLLAWNRTSLLNALPSDHATISTRIYCKFEERKQAIRTVLKSSQSKISLSVDVWTSPNYYSILAVVAHFFGKQVARASNTKSLTADHLPDANNNPTNLLIGFNNLISDHSGAGIGSSILETIDSYDIASKFHCFVGDNATSNDGALIAALDEHPELSVNEEHRIRCTGHIINLVVKAVLYGDGVSQWEQQLLQTAPRDQFQLFRKQGVVGRLHNFVTAVNSSHKRRELFKRCQRELQLTHKDDNIIYESATLSLLKDGGIRWNAVYLMLQRCYDLREAIARFTTHWRLKGDARLDEQDGYSLVDDADSDVVKWDEWEQVHRILRVLKPFIEMTLWVEGNTNDGGFGSLWQQLPDLQHLWRHLHKVTDELDGTDVWLENAVKFGISKLTTYFVKIVVEPAVSTPCVATVLAPRCRLLWFKDHWRKHPDWYKKAERSIRDVCKRYAELQEIDEDLLFDDDGDLRRRKLPGCKYDDFEATLAVNTEMLTGSTRSHKRTRFMSELDVYIDEAARDLLLADQDPTSAHAVLLLGCPIRWWQRVGHKRFPLLYIVAKDYLAIPATSCECERCFSKANRTLPTDRNRLSAELLEALQLQRNWIKRRAVQSDLNRQADFVRRQRPPPSDSSSVTAVTDSNCQ